MHYLTIFSIQKNEDPYVKDFVDFHKFMGVDHIVIMDHGSTNPIKNLFVNDPQVTVIPFPGYKVHAEAWQHCCVYYREFTKWGLFIDCDQFFVPKDHSDIKEFVKEYDNDPKIAGIQINWHTVGNSGHEAKPEVNQLLAFNKRAKDEEGVNGHTQSLVRMANVDGHRWHDPHHCTPKPGCFNINEHRKVIVNSPFNVPITHDKASIYHLYTRSKEEFIHKQKRGRADIIGEHLDMRTYDDYNAFCNAVEDNTLAEIYKKMTQT